jgi:DNA-binding NarL/FixJ family response regulator
MRGNGDRTAVILDRHPLWLEALEDLLQGVGVAVVGKTTSRDEALELVDQEGPTVFVAEYESLSDADDGLDGLRSASGGDMHTVVLSDREDPERIEAAFAAGASVYCMKTADSDDLAAAIRQAFQSSVYFAGARARPVVASGPSAPEEDPGLTKREVEILRLVAEGHSNSQLAKMLWVTEQTVKFHLSNIYRKLDVANRTEASRWAQLNGLLEPVKEAVAAA